MPPPSASGSARRGIAGRASATSRSPTSRSWTTCRPRAPIYTDEVMDAAAAGDLMARRRVEDERFAYFAEASIVFLDLPDAVFRGYEGDEQLLGAPRADDDRPVRAPPPRDRPARAAEGLLPAGRRRPRRPPALPRGRHPAPPGGPPLGDARPRLRRDRHLLRGLPVRLVERLPPARGPRARRPAPASRPTSASRRVTPTSPTSSSARSRASTSTRASWSACSTARRRWPTPSAPTDARSPSSARSTAPPSATGSPAASDPVTPGAAGTGRAPGAAGRRRCIVGLIAALVAGIVIRVVLLPTEGLRGDLDQFVLWVHGIAVDGLPQRLRPEPLLPAGHGLRLGPAGGRPAGLPDRHRRLRSGDPGADEDPGLARRHRARRCWWPTRCATGLDGRSSARRRSLLHPAVIDISAWWGQYESIYMLSALAAVVCAVERPERAGRRAPGGRAHDQAPGAAVPRPVRRLVLGDRRAGAGSCGRRRSAWP